MYPHLLRECPVRLLLSSRSTTATCACVEQVFEASVREQLEAQRKAADAQVPRDIKYP